MRREGRQHGMVRNFLILPPPLNTRPNSRVVNAFDSPPTAGMYTKVSCKPTNHLKPTGKCAHTKCWGCHTHPFCKSRSKGKGKGTQKLKSCDVTSNPQLIGWRVVDKSAGINYMGDQEEQS